MATGILIVSHSEKLAEGIVELISEMANDSVVIKQAGGTEDGRLNSAICGIIGDGECESRYKNSIVLYCAHSEQIMLIFV